MKERIQDRTIGVLGLWHLGCSIAAAWSKLGFTVTGVDEDRTRVADLAVGKLPLYEPGLEEIFRSALDAGTLTFSSDVEALRGCRYVFLSYDTPVDDDDSCDTSILWRSIEALSDVLSDGSVVIVSSQTPVGLCRELRDRLRKEKKTLELCYSPENLRLGNALDCYLNPGRVILGVAEPNCEVLCRELFETLDCEILSMTLESAELVKHGINAFLASCIVFGNSLSDVCERVGGKMEDVVRGLRTDPRIGTKAYIAPGTGFSGGTLGRDLVVLGSKYASQVSDQGDYFTSLYRFNQERTHRLVERIDQISNGVARKKIGALGLTYKAGTSTLRRSLPLEIVNALVARGAEVRVFDPRADYSELSEKPKFQQTASATETANGSDLVLLLTEWPEFRDLDFKSIAASMTEPRLFDLKGYLNRTELERAGFAYSTIGS